MANESVVCAVNFLPGPIKQALSIGDLVWVLGSGQLANENREWVEGLGEQMHCDPWHPALRGPLGMMSEPETALVGGAILF